MAKMTLMNSIYKTLIILSVIILLVILLFVLLATWKIPYNNLYLKSFQESFNIIVNPMHPEQSKLIIEIAETGNWANGSQCQYFVGQFRVSTLSKEIVRQSYFKESMSSGIDFINEDAFNYEPLSGWKEKYLKNYKSKENENVYFVWILDGDKFTDGDIRCN